MADNLSSRLKNAWNAFRNRDPTDAYDEYYIPNLGSANYIRPDRPRFTPSNERTILNSIFNRIAVDCSSIAINHVRLDENGRYSETIDSGMNSCLSLSANKDQTGRAFVQDIVMSMFDEGCVAIVPVDTDDDIWKTNSYDVLSFRTAKITQWYPDHVQLYLYNDRNGKKETIVLPKSDVAIVENPFYSVMNEPNSTVKRLTHKLNLLDVIDEQSGAGKLDLIIQLPYVIKTEMRRQQAEMRKKDIEDQLANSKYGIAYTDSTEHITQLNRSLNNNLMDQIKYLMDLLYSQLGITAEIMNGTASEAVMLNYNNRTIEPIMSAIVDSMKRTFLTQTARTQGQSIMYFRDPFKLVPAVSLAEIADKFTRNEVLTSNEIRQIIGIKPSSDPKADELRNKNIAPDAQGAEGEAPPEEEGQTNPEDLVGQVLANQ